MSHKKLRLSARRKARSPPRMGLLRETRPEQRWCMLERGTRRQQPARAVAGVFGWFRLFCERRVATNSALLNFLCSVRWVFNVALLLHCYCTRVRVQLRCGVTDEARTQTDAPCYLSGRSSSVVHLISLYDPSSLAWRAVPTSIMS